MAEYKSDLLSFIHEHRFAKISRESLPERELCYILIRLVEILHEQGLIHRDLKPGNVLLSYEEGLIKLADFGVTIFQKTFGYTKSLQVGTPGFMAPEMLEGNSQYDSKVDIWALGCTLHEILYRGKPAFPDCADDEYLNKYNSLLPSNGDGSEMRTYLSRGGASDECVNMLVRALTQQDKRCTARELAEDPYFDPVREHCDKYIARTFVRSQDVFRTQDLPHARRGADLEAPRDVHNRVPRADLPAAPQQPAHPPLARAQDGPDQNVPHGGCAVAIEKFLSLQQQYYTMLDSRREDETEKASLRQKYEELQKRYDQDAFIIKRLTRFALEVLVITASTVSDIVRAGVEVYKEQREKQKQRREYDERQRKQLRDHRATPY